MVTNNIKTFQNMTKKLLLIIEEVDYEKLKYLQNKRLVLMMLGGFFLFLLAFVNF